MLGMIDDSANFAATDVQGPNWEEHEWSAWHALEGAIAPRNAKAPEVPGLYRIRCAGHGTLIYIGETGDSLRSRFRQLRTAMQYADQGWYSRRGKTGGPPHVAGGCVRNHQRQGYVIEVSWFEAPKPRKA